MNFLVGNKKNTLYYTVYMHYYLIDKLFILKFLFVLLQKIFDIAAAAKKFCYVMKEILYYN